MNFKVTKSPIPGDKYPFSIVMDSEKTPNHEEFVNDRPIPIITNIKTESEANFLMFMLEQGFTIGWNQASYNGFGKLHFVDPQLI